MNKIRTAILFVAVCGLNSFANELQPLPENPTFTEVRNASFTPEKIQKIKSGRFVFYVENTKNQKGYMMLRAKQYDQVRIDAVINKEFYTAVRNGDDFWVYNKNDGKISMTAEEREDFEQYIAFLPFPVSKKQIFSKPVFIKNEKVNKSQRAVFESKGTDMTVQMSIDTKTRTLRKIKVTDKDDQIGFIKVYSNYKQMAGINLPHMINISKVNTNITMKLITADINLELEPAIFDRKAPLIDQYLAMIRDNYKEQEALKVQKKTTANNKAREEQLERKIIKLKAEIQDCERRMAKIEQLSVLDRTQATSAASGGGSRYYWNGSCWGYRSRSDRAQRRMQRELTREIKELNTNYSELSDRLMRRRAELSEAEYELKKLKK